MKVNMCDLGIQDAEQMAALYATCFEDIWEPVFFQNKLKESCFSKGVFLQGDLIGFILVQLVEDEAEILTFCVHKNYRKQGIGRSLLEHILKQSKIKSCFLEVRAQNQAAVSLYESLGFKKKGVRGGYYSVRDSNKEQISEDAIICIYSKK